MIWLDIKNKIPPTTINASNNARDIAKILLIPLRCILFTSGFNKMAMINEKAMGATISFRQKSA
jgi:hypothetical protein